MNPFPTFHPETTGWLSGGNNGILTAASLGAATLVQEDLPTIAAAVLAAAGRLSWITAFLGCFLGIWLGDALLYLAARGLGRPLLRLPGFRRLATAEAITRSERWFAQRGPWLLASSRFLPGTRLPTYLAAGFLRVPLPQFLGVTGAAVAVWTGTLFLLAQLLGARLGETLTSRPLAIPAVVGTVLLVLWLVRALTRQQHHSPARRSPTFRQRFAATVARWRQWEFWPAGIFYLPVAANYLRLSIHHRSVTLPACANPGIRAGGLVGESKIETLRQLQETSPEFTAEAWLLEPASPAQRHVALKALQEAVALPYPFILKPDLGQRGQGVRLIRTEADAKRCLEESPVPLVVQRYAPGPGEAGVFYFRFPDQSRGRIFSITEKVFPHVTGDGHRTVEELIWDDPRARCLAGRYLQRLGSRRHEVPQPGETIRLVEAGNHAQGCIFRNGARLNSPQLEAAFDAVSQRIPGFFIGRFDVRFTSEDEFQSGRPGSFTILELNGASAEATHIYDARTRLSEAYQTLFQQWEMVFAIGAENRRRGAGILPTRELLRLWRDASRQFASYPIAD